MRTVFPLIVIKHSTGWTPGLRWMQSIPGVKQIWYFSGKRKKSDIRHIGIHAIKDTRMARPGVRNIRGLVGRNIIYACAELTMVREYPYWVL